MAEEALRSTSPKANFHRLARLLMRGGVNLLRETFDSIHSPADLPLRLAQPTIQSKLRGARLTQPEMVCLNPSPGVYGESNDFDITLIFKLFRTICGLTPPAGPRGWDDLPNDSDHTLVADLVRIKYYRNKIYHNPTMEISDIDFIPLWEEISEALLRIATNISPAKREEWEKSIYDLLRNPLTPDGERCIKELETWYKQDMDVKDELVKLREELKSRQPTFVVKINNFYCGPLKQNIDVSTCVAMASPSTSPFASSIGETNGVKLWNLVTNRGAAALRILLNKSHSPQPLATWLSQHKQTLSSLKHRVLKDDQWRKLFPSDGTQPDCESFDITLLGILLINICGLSPPNTGWNDKPPRSDRSTEANIARIRYFRNLLSHAPSTGVTTQNFNSYWEEISDALVALGLDQNEIDALS